MGLLKVKSKAYVWLGAVFLAALSVLGLFVGKYPLSLRALLDGNAMQWNVFLTLRLSRVIVGVIGGFALGVSGFVYQIVFRNQLASPDIIGVSSGASAGAAAGILFLGSAAAVTISSFVGALAAVTISLLLASVDRSGRKSTAVLAGIAVHALMQTVLMALKLTADPNRELAAIEYWIMGSLSDISSYRIGINMVLCIASMIVLFFMHRQILLLSANEGEARMLGVRVGRMRLLVLAVATLTVSCVVSLTGLISFIGLMAPHIARYIMRDNRRDTMLLSGIAGGILLCTADLFARSAAQSELPVSIFTSILGAPFLIGLVLKARYRNDDA